MTVFDDLFEVIPASPDRHATSDPLWRIWKAAAAPSVRELFSSADQKGHPFGPFGDLSLPYFKMGNIDSLDLFGLDEIILFSFYNANRNRYRRVVDMGANIGLHSIILSRCGFEVRSFEPDPVHISQLRLNLELNGATIDLHNAAVSLEDGEAEFVRVKGNTTGNHLKGAKSSPYGDLETFKVRTEAASKHLSWTDLAKIDIEGHEATLLSGLPHDTWLNTDAIVEIGTPANADIIFRHFSGSKTNLFAQKIGWQKVNRLEDMPTSHRDGSLFISSKPAMPWNVV